CLRFSVLIGTNESMACEASRMGVSTDTPERGEKRHKNRGFRRWPRLSAAARSQPQKLGARPFGRAPRGEAREPAPACGLPIRTAYGRFCAVPGRETPPGPG